MKDPKGVVQITSRQRAVGALEGAWMAAHKMLKSDAVSTLYNNRPGKHAAVPTRKDRVDK